MCSFFSCWVLRRQRALARGGAWTFFFRSGYTAQAIDFEASPFYMTVVNLMKIAENDPFRSLAKLLENKNWTWPPNKYISHVWRSPPFLSFFSELCERTPRKRYGQKTLMNEMFIVEPVLDIDARWSSVWALCGDAVSPPFVKPRMLRRHFLTFLRCGVVSGTGGSDLAGPY